LIISRGEGKAGTVGRVPCQEEKSCSGFRENRAAGM